MFLKVHLDSIDNMGEVELIASHRRVRITKLGGEPVWEWQGLKDLYGDSVAAKWNKKQKLLSLRIPFK